MEKNKWQEMITYWRCPSKFLLFGLYFWNFLFSSFMIVGCSIKTLLLNPFFFFHDCSIVRILRILALLPSHSWKFSIVLKTKVNGYEQCYDILSFFNRYWFCPKSNFQFRPFKCIMKSKSLNDNINIQDWKPFLSWDFSNPLFIF